MKLIFVPSRSVLKFYIAEVLVVKFQRLVSRIRLAL
jgi:hypothetical protein